jgi:mRNA-degrading endonuclease RelE of RelBE toxin-antitoxin system
MIKKLIKKLKKLVKKINKRMVAKIHKLTQPTRPRRKIGRPLGAKDKVKRKSPRKDLTRLL